MKYRSEIDGLRALAVLPVILFHAGFPLFRGGFVGVDIFFVISGYLITKNILAEVGEGKFSFARFYERRIRRILPAQFAMVFVLLPVAWWVLWPGDLVEFAKGLIYLALFGANLLYYKSSGYFDSSAELKPLLHTWSLSVEEQFYFIFPAVVLLTWRFGRKATVAVIATVSLLSLTCAEWQVGRNTAAAFYLLPARFWEIGLGSLLAFHDKEEQPAPKRFGEIAGLTGLALILGAVFIFDEHTPNPGLYTLIPNLGAALILVYARHDSRAGTFLRNRLCVGIGLVSYSAYLWHQPLLAFARHLLPSGLNTTMKLALIGLTLLTAWLSWRFVELPFRRQHKAGSVRIALYALCCALGVIAIAQITRQHQGFETYFNSHRLNPEQQRIYTLITEQTRENPVKSLLDDGQCRFRSEQLDARFEQRFAACTERFGKAALIIGDSHAINIFNGLYREGGIPFLVSLSQVSCRPYDPKPECPYGKLDSFLARHGTNLNYLIYHQSGSHLMRDRWWGMRDHSELFSRPGNYTIETGDIGSIASYLEQLAQYTRVYWLGPFAEARVSFSNFNQFASGFHMNPLSLAAFREMDSLLQQTESSGKQHWQYLSALEALAMSADYLMIDDCITFRDKDHFSVCGERIAGQRLARRLAALPRAAQR